MVLLAFDTVFIKLLLLKHFLRGLHRNISDVKLVLGYIHNMQVALFFIILELRQTFHLHMT
jgi:hypothetical protein